MAKHWRDQFLDKPGARDADAERRLENSEEWERAGADANQPGGRPGVRLGERTSSSPIPRSVPRGGARGMGIQMRAGGGARMETQRGAAFDNVAVSRPAPQAAADEATRAESAPAPSKETAPPRKQRGALGDLAHRLLGIFRRGN